MAGQQRRGHGPRPARQQRKERASAQATEHKQQNHIRIQFLAEAILLALAGGVAGVLAGSVATVVYARAKGWATVIPPVAWAGGLGATIVIGAAAGLLPALRAARMSPTQALWTP